MCSALVGRAHFNLPCASIFNPCLILAEAHYRLGVAYGHLHKHKEAADCFRRAISKQDYVEAHLDLGVIYLLLGNKSAAVEEHRKLQSLNPVLADELFRAIYKDKILTVSPRVQLDDRRPR